MNGFDAVVGRAILAIVPLVPFFLIASSDEIARGRRAIWSFGSAIGSVLMAQLPAILWLSGLHATPTSVAIAQTWSAGETLAFLSQAIHLLTPWAIYGVFRLRTRRQQSPDDYVDYDKFIGENRGNPGKGSG